MPLRDYSLHFIIYHLSFIIFFVFRGLTAGREKNNLGQSEFVP